MIRPPCRTRVLTAALAAALFAVLAPAPLPALQAAPESLESMTRRAAEAVSRSAFESAAAIYAEAKASYPASPAPWSALAELYYDRELWALAVTEYLGAEERGADDYATLTQIARCYGKLNRERDCIQWLVKTVQAYPDSADAADDLGWMYFKTHQLAEGERVVLAAVARLGARRGLEMTLGTIYSGMNRYGDARRAYLRAIAEAQAEGDRQFAAIAFYNLSLLEEEWFRWPAALAATDDSLAQEDRASGHLARGELMAARMDWTAAEREYLAADARDTTPLSTMSLAGLSLTFGRLEAARRYAEDVLSSKDLAWLLYYGTDATRHFEDLHELLAGAHMGLATREARRPTAGLLDRLGALVAAARDALSAWYHRQRFRALALEVGTQYWAEGSLEDAWGQFVKANERYPDVALEYLALAREAETARAPHAASLYLVEEGRLRGSAAMLREGLAGLDPQWERDHEAEGLLALIPLLRGRGDVEERRAALGRLWSINPGALPQAGLGLPLSVSFDGGRRWTWREKAALLRFLRRSGSECDEGGGLPWELVLSGDASGPVRWTVRERATGAIAAGGRSPMEGRLLVRCAGLANAVLADLYAVH